MSFKGLTIGVSGLKSQAKKMEVVGHNLANINTAGFKKSTVSFHELFSETIKGASAGDGSNLGGTNPMESAGGVGISAITKVFTQGAHMNSARSLDFMVEGDDFFVVRNGTNNTLMLTRNGNFFLDKDLFLTDSLGNKVLGYNIDRDSGSPGTQAEALRIDNSALPPKASTELGWSGNIDSSVKVSETLADGIANGWEVFSGGENFGGMEIASIGDSGTLDIYGSHYYIDNMLYQDTAATYNTGSPSDIVLSATPTNLIEGFSVGDAVSVLQGTEQVQRTIAAINTGTRTLTLSGALPGGFTSGTTTLTNLSQGTTNRGSSGSTAIHNDILKSQISMVDGDGKLLANFYRVGSQPQKYTTSTANVAGGGTLTVGTGEFTNIHELKQLMEEVLRDGDLTNFSTTTDLNVSLDKFGAMSFGGTGMVQNFRLIMNADNTEMLDRFSGIAMTDAAAGGTQALLDSNGEVMATPSLGLGDRTVNSSKAWYSTTGIENYGYNSAKQATEYGEFAGLRLDSGATGTGYGVIELSVVNGLGESVTQEFRLVPRDAEPSNNEFTTMGELSVLLQNTLRSPKFSSRAIDGNLVSDDTALASFEGGRLNVSTSMGVFNNLSISPKNITQDTPSGISRTDQDNFGTVLGELSTGVYGKSGTSNKFIQADMKSQKTIFDSQGNEHSAVTYFIRDRSAGLTNVEWKFKSGLNPNLNTFVQANTTDNDIYGESFNSIEDTGTAFGTLAFDITTGNVMGSASDARYSDRATLTFTARTNSQEADESVMNIDFSTLTSFKGKNTVEGTSNGYGMGDLVRLATEKNTGNINGVYSNGQVRNLAKIGLMHINNPEGLEKVGSSYFSQTPNSTAGGTAKGIDQIYAVGDVAGASSDSVQSRVHGSALEGSNVDLTEELTDMIVTQRSYSASGKIITTSDDMLQEALNLKR